MGFVPPIKNKEHYIFDKKDFEGVANIAVTVMSVFNIMLEKFSEEFETNDILRAFISQILPELLYLILEHVLRRHVIHDVMQTLYSHYLVVKDIIVNKHQ
jgi:magnesium-transporting ATPase (P-type)